MTYNTQTPELYPLTQLYENDIENEQIAIQNASEPLENYLQYFQSLIYNLQIL